MKIVLLILFIVLGLLIYGQFLELKRYYKWEFNAEKRKAREERRKKMDKLAQKNMHDIYIEIKEAQENGTHDMTLMNEYLKSKGL